MSDSKVILVGATGNLGGRIARELRKREARVTAFVRPGTAQERIEALQRLRVNVTVVDLSNEFELIPACEGATCIVSALQGLQNEIVGAQRSLLDAAVKAGVPRFFPSDYSIDFTRFPQGRNRNLDLRRSFHRWLDNASISATTIFNGAFADMLTGQMPLIQSKLSRVLYWGDPDQLMDFTTIDDTAAYTSSAALDVSTPRFLHIAGDSLSARELASVASEVTGKEFRLLRAGSLGMLGAMIKIGQFVAPGEQELYPAWQGMQYMRDMLDGRALVRPLDNDRYSGLHWTSVQEVLGTHPR